MIHTQLSKEFSIPEYNVINIISLFDEDNEIPYIARYCRDKTKVTDPDILYALQERLKYLRRLETRKTTILRKFIEAGLLDSNTESTINGYTDIGLLDEFHDLMFPKEPDEASKAIEKGLKHLADSVYTGTDIEKTLKVFKKKNPTISEDEITQGVFHILEKYISTDEKLIEHSYKKAKSASKVAVKVKRGVEGFEDVAEGFAKPLEIPSLKLLKLARAKHNKELDFSFELDDELIAKELTKVLELDKNSVYADLKKDALKSAYASELRKKIVSKLKKELFERAENDAVTAFEKNLHNLLMQKPLSGSRILGFDPGITNGCKLAVIDETGALVDTAHIYITGRNADKEKAFKILDELHARTKFEIVALGNGTAVTESESFLQEWLSR